MVAWPLIYALFYGPAIRHEDAKLRRRFGEAWCAWSRHTPALLPARLPSGPLHLRRWSVRQVLRNGEPVWRLLLLAGPLNVLTRPPGAGGARNASAAARKARLDAPAPSRLQ